MNAIEHVAFGLTRILAVVMRHGAWLVLPLYAFIGYSASKELVVSLYCGAGAFIVWRWGSRSLLEIAELIKEKS